MSQCSNFAKISTFDDRIKKIVFGFIRNSQKLLPKNNQYYNIPDLVIQICLLYYLINDKFDKKCIGNQMFLDEKNETIIMKKSTSNSAFLTNIIEYG